MIGRPCREASGGTRGGAALPAGSPPAADQPEEQLMLVDTASGFVLSFSLRISRVVISESFPLVKNLSVVVG